MSNLDHTYESVRDISDDRIDYYFVSNGVKDIIKVIQYSFVTNLNGQKLFNLGFGDYDPTGDSVSDDQTSNNKDQYKVFNTVLKTVPDLFETFGDVILMIRGSDSTEAFMIKCKISCSKGCSSEICKKAHRRIGVYRGYVDKNYDNLSKGYGFYGGDLIGNQYYMEPYQVGKEYLAVFLVKKKV